ncbi:hypothetical protein [uncultured Fusobacterium sp.]|uniref:hypothetical protein n=1 Tax=uncultured Fusobacterium sp. TaxID=159267 RepID=UPI0035A6FD7E
MGSNLVLELLRTFSSVTVLAIDSINDYYDVKIKEWRLQEIEKEVKNHTNSKWNFIKGNITDKSLIDKVFTEFKPQ